MSERMADCAISGRVARAASWLRIGTGRLACGVCLAWWAAGAAAGPLSPPSGPIGPTDAGIEFTQAKTVIDTLPFTIAAPGSYIVTQDLSGFGGIDVLVSDVSIDLNGYTLRGVGSGAEPGVEVFAGLTNISIQRGTIEQWGGDGISAGSASSGVIGQMIIADNGGDGIDVGDGWAIVNCTIRDNAGRGIGGGNNGTVEGSQIDNNQAEGAQLGDGWSINETSVSNNAACGIMAGTGTNVTQSVALDNAGPGFGLGRNSAIGQSVAENNAVGIAVEAGSVVYQCTARGGGGGIETVGEGSQIVSCSVLEVDGSGITAIGSVVRDCLVVGGGGAGIDARDGSLIERSVVRLAPNGIVVSGSGTSVRGCTLTGNDVGLVLGGTGNLAEGNTAGGSQILNYDFRPGNAWGIERDVAFDGPFQEPTSFSNLSY